MAGGAPHQGLAHVFPLMNYNTVLSYLTEDSMGLEGDLVSEADTSKGTGEAEEELKFSRMD